ncbi:MAG: hypothetical protein AUJ98_03525 [Bacteroidetes bacterium CG2_30_33_31]|nr:MAG: hypothetical protein AUJ98_03525 [Bacteroidetes bacterium CG2_30_33_31]
MSNSFVVFKKRAQKNINTMAQKAKANNLVFRPHFKTHQNIEIGKLFLKEGVSFITVSSLNMAKFFSDYGWDDITIAFPLDIGEINEIDQLAKKINLQILITNKTHLEHLSSLKNRVGVMIEIDTGYHRTGIDFKKMEEVKSLITDIYAQPNLFFMGLLSHYGNSYQSRGKEQIEGTYNRSTHRLIELQKRLAKELGSVIFLSIGDTPTTSVVTKFDGIDEIRPGNFVYYDLMQLQIGSCDISQIAAVVRCPVVDKNPKEKQLIIHGGAVHFSKEIIDIESPKSYGRVVDTSTKNWILSDSFVSSLSQEHGIVQCTDIDFEKYKIGDLIDIIPVHSCLTANLMKENTVII